MTMMSTAEAEQIVQQSSLFEDGLPASEALADATELPGDEAPAEDTGEEEAPVEPAAPAAEVIALQQKVEALERQATERNAAEKAAADRALQAATAAEITQGTTAIMDWLQNPQNFLTNGAVDEMNAARLRPIIEAGIKVRSASFLKDLENYNGYVQGLEAKAHSLDQILNHFPPNTTLASIKAHLTDLTGIRDPEYRERQAKQLAAEQLRKNQAARIDSRAENVPGGRPTAGGATDRNTLINKVADGSASRQEEVRLQQMLTAEGL